MKEGVLRNGGDYKMDVSGWLSKAFFGGKRPGKVLIAMNPY